MKNTKKLFLTFFLIVSLLVIIKVSSKVEMNGVYVLNSGNCSDTLFISNTGEYSRVYVSDSVSIDEGRYEIDDNKVLLLDYYMVCYSSEIEKSLYYHGEVKRNGHYLPYRTNLFGRVKKIYWDIDNDVYYELQ